MAIFNDVANKLEAGSNIAFTSNEDTGAVIISSVAPTLTATPNAVAIYADTIGTLANSGIIIDSNNNISGALSVITDTVYLTNGSSLIAISASPNLITPVNYIMPDIGETGSLLAINSVNGNTASLNWVNAPSGGIISVQGTSDRITVSGGSAPTVDISNSYVGQTSISTLGTINTGTWSANNLTESQVTNLTSDLAATEKSVNKNTAGGYCPLDSSTLVPIANIPNLPESQITNLTSNLAACEKTTYKNTANGYCPLDSNSLVPITNIPSLSESQVTNLTSDLAATEKFANKGIAYGYCALNSSALVAVSNLPNLPESQITNLTTDLAACEKTANKDIASGYCGLDSNSLVPVVNIPNITESMVTNLATDLAATEKTSNKNIASGYCPLDSNALVPTANIPNLSESQITNLTSDLSARERTVNKGAANGYCGLDTNGLVAVSNIPSLAESQISNLTTDLAAKADLVNGVLSTSEIPTTIVTSINSITTTNNAITLTTDDVSEGSTNKYYHNILPIAESDVTGLVTDLSACEKTANKGAPNGYCSLDSNSLVSVNNIPSLSESKITGLASDLASCEKSANKGAASGYCGLDSSAKVALTNLASSVITNASITSPVSGQTLNYDGTNWVNTTPSSGVTQLSALSDVGITSAANNNMFVYTGSTTSKWENYSASGITFDNINKTVTVDLSSCEKTANKGSASGYCGLDSSSLVSVNNIPSLAESKITNLTTDLAATEKSANKNVAGGYCPLDSNTLVPVTNIPSLAESKITNLTTDLAAKEVAANKGVAGGYCALDSNSLVPVINIPNITESMVTNLTTDLAACEKSANKGAASGYCGLDSNSLVSTSNIPSLAESKITNLTTDLAACEKSANKNVASGYCPLDSNVLVPINNLASSVITNANISSPSNNQGLVYKTSSSTWVNQQVDHTVLSNIGTNTHAQIDTFIASKGQASGLAVLDSNSYIALSELGNCTNNTITFYVDSKYTGAVNDGSILKPYTTISAALANIVTPVDNTDPHLSDRYIIHVAGGMYDESLTIPGARHITFVADGLVFLGTTASQYLGGMSSAGHIRDVNIQIFRNTAVTATYYRATTVFTTTSYMQRGAAYTHTGLQGGWWLSGIVNIGALTGSAFNDVEIELIDVKCCDYSDTGVGGSRASTGYFINNNSTWATSWSGNINVKMTGCRGNGINFPYGGNFNNFNLYELNNCYMLNMLNVGKVGLIQHTTFYATSGFAANTLLGIGSSYQPYYSEMIDCACQTGSSFSTTSANTLYIDNATWVKSNGAITTSGSLTLNIDYGFPNKTNFASLTNGQVISWDNTNSRFINTTPSSGVTQLSALSDVSIASIANDNMLVYTTNAGTNKWENYSVTGMTFDDTNKTITVTGGISAVNGTTDRIAVSGTSTRTVDIASTYVGQTSITTLGTITTGVWNGTATDVAHGGTNSTSFTAYGVLCGGTTSTGSLQSITAGAAGTFFKSGGASALPTWGSIAESDVTNLTTDLAATEKTANKGSASGYCGLDSSSKVSLTNINTIDVAHGGTGVISFSTAYGILCAGTTTTGALQVMSAGTANQILVSGGSSATPSWSSVTIDSSSNIAGVATLTCNALAIHDGGSYTITMQTPTLSASSTYTMPTAVGTTGQVLTASNGTGTLSWATPLGAITALSGLTTDVNISNPVTGDVLRYVASQWTNTTDLSTLSNVVLGLNQTQLEILNTTASVVQNNTILASYTDSIIGSMLFIDNSIATFQTPTTITYDSTNVFAIPVPSGTMINNSMLSGATPSYYRINIAYTNPFVCTYFEALPTYGLSNPTTTTYDFYGSNSLTAYNDTTSSTNGLTLLYSTSVTYPSTTLIAPTISNSNSYKYYHVIYTLTSGTSCRPGLTNIRFQRPAGGYIGLVNNTDFSISTNASDGLPLITYLDAATNNISINYSRLLYSETQRRLFPVVRDKNTIVLTDGTNTSTLTSTSITATGLKTVTTTVSVSGATAPTSGQVLTATSSTAATWQTPSSGSPNVSAVSSNVSAMVAETRYIVDTGASNTITLALPASGVTVGQKFSVFALNTGTWQLTCRGSSGSPAETFYWDSTTAVSGASTTGYIQGIGGQGVEIMCFSTTSGNKYMVVNAIGNLTVV